MRKLLLLVVTCVAVLSSCSKEQFELEFTSHYAGTADTVRSAIANFGLKKIYMGTMKAPSADAVNIIDSAEIENYSFTFRGDVPAKDDIYFLFVKDVDFMNAEYTPVAFFVPEKGTIRMQKFLLEDNDGLGGTPKNEEVSKQLVAMSRGINVKEFMAQIEEVSNRYNVKMDSIGKVVDQIKNPDLFSELMSSVAAERNAEQEQMLKAQQAKVYTHLSEHMGEPFAKGLLIFALSNSNDNPLPREALIGLLSGIDPKDEDMSEIRTYLEKQIEESAGK